MPSPTVIREASSDRDGSTCTDPYPSPSSGSPAEVENDCRDKMKGLILAIIGIKGEESQLKGPKNIFKKIDNQKFS